MEYENELLNALEEKAKLKLKIESQIYYGMKLEPEAVEHYNSLIDLIRKGGKI